MLSQGLDELVRSLFFIGNDLSCSIFDKAAVHIAIATNLLPKNNLYPAEPKT